MRLFFGENEVKSGNKKRCWTSNTCVVVLCSWQDMWMCKRFSLWMQGNICLHYQTITWLRNHFYFIIFYFLSWMGYGCFYQTIIWQRKTIGDWWQVYLGDKHLLSHKWSIKSFKKTRWMHALMYSKCFIYIGIEYGANLHPIVNVRSSKVH